MMITKRRFETIIDKIEAILMANKIGLIEPKLIQSDSQSSMQWLLVLAERHQWPKASLAISEMIDHREIKAHLSDDGLLSIIANH